MIDYFRKLIPLDSPARLGYHFVRAYGANVMNGFPGRANMKIIWVTGTNWKTTTTNIIAKALKASGKKVFMFSTVNYIMGDIEETNYTKMTSPDVFVIQRMLKEAVKQGCEYAIIETSSHSLAMYRCFGIEYDTAVLTNISQDHLDLHKTMKNYINTKLKLFKQLIWNKRKPWVKKTAIVNGDISEKDIFLEPVYDKEFTYGFDETCSLRATNIVETFEKTTFDVKIPWDTIKIETKLRWKFNVYNILAAITVLLDSSIPAREIEKSISNVTWVPWRMEEVENHIWASILIDYAHTPDALENVLSTVRQIEWVKRVITVFWATWDRDKTKRPKMWEIVSKYSDVIILTQDDDYSEDTISIIKDIMPGIDRKQGDSFYVIPERYDAIRQALLVARSWDIVLIAWKWDENSMITNEWVVHWHDKKVTKEILKELDDNRIITK